MSDLGGPESFAPGEAGSGAPEALSEEAKQRFAAAAAGMQQIRREEKKSKKRDDQVAKVIVQFLGDEKHTHLFVLVSRLVARDCPSIFILSILSLIHPASLQTVEDALKDLGKEAADQADAGLAIAKNGELDEASNRTLALWITRMQLVLSIDPHGILLKLMIDDKNIDGTVLQLTTFVLQEFFQTIQRHVEFEKLQPLTASILQTVFEPFIAGVRKQLLARTVTKDEDE